MKSVVPSSDELCCAHAADGALAFPLAGRSYEEENPENGDWRLQGTYECSARPWTIWEHKTSSHVDSPFHKFDAYVHDHPNYYSRYMDESFGWDDLHWKQAPLVRSAARARRPAYAAAQLIGPVRTCVGRRGYGSHHLGVVGGRHRLRVTLVVHNAASTAY